ncbi:hypothetical protein [Spiroplasma endosymbiont of Zeiraphera isertana]|uniref:hypothetical protein n=1 Tax=Spiroplasma endosymbiont of Zeiraphera isertana TaxID=3066313 RepID=UPI00313DA9F3
MSAENYRNINSHNRWGIIVSSGLMAITLIISWVLWLILYRTNVNEILVILTEVINSKGITFTLTFQILTIFTLIFSVITLVFITIPFIFLNKYGVITLVWALIVVVISLVLLIGSGLLISYGYKKIYSYVMDKKIIHVLFFILPWGFVLICSFFLVLFSLLLIITNLRNKSKKALSLTNNNALSATEIPTSVEQNSLFGEQTIGPSFTDRFFNEHDKSTQGINIVINNTGGGALPQSKLLDNQVTSNPNPVQTNNSSNVVNSEVTWTPQQIEEVWNKGEIIDDYNPQLYRKDYAGALMFKNNFISNVKLNDDPKSYNWTIIHQRPLFHGGTSDISNLQPMNNTNAITKGNNYPRWKTAITFNGKQNFLKQKSWKDKK